MKVEAKKFSELSVKELYELLKLRTEIFVVEQECIYQDMDGKDNKAVHILGKQEDTLEGQGRQGGAPLLVYRAQRPARWR